MTHTRRGLTTTQIVLIVVGAIVLVFGCIIAGLVAIMFPALANARTSAREIMSEAQIKQVMLAADVRAASEITEVNADLPMATTWTLAVDEMLMEGAIGSSTLDSPFDDDGVADDYWVYPHPFDTAEVNPLGLRIVMYDREMYATHETVAVGFSDGSTDRISIADFNALLRTAPNAQTDLNLPTRTP